MSAAVRPRLASALSAVPGVRRSQDIDRTGWGFQLSLTEIRRSEPDERGNYEWTLEGDGITISLGAPGFTQYLRRPPVHCPDYTLSVEERGGFSFDRHGYRP